MRRTSRAVAGTATAALLLSSQLVASAAPADDPLPPPDGSVATPVVSESPTTPTTPTTPTSPSASPTSPTPTEPTKPSETTPIPATPTPTSGTPDDERQAQADAAAVTLTLDAASPSTQWEDRPVRLSGRLSNHASWSVSLWRRTGSGWTRVGYVRATKGEFAVTVRPTSPGTWSVKAVLGASPNLPVQSQLRGFTVRNRTIALTRPASAYTALTNVTLSGRLTPAEPGRMVYLEYPYGGRWRAFAYGKADGNGTFRIRVPDNFPYQWRVRARTVTSPASAIEYTPVSYRFDVKAYLWPQVTAVSSAYLPSTYRSGCPVGPSKLRRLILTHWGFDKRLHRGELIVRDKAVSAQIAVWNAAIINRFYVRTMRRVDIYGGSDVRSMAADNTSAFNCRQVTGDPYSLSPHSYGYATDVNTVENPYYAANGKWYPSNGLSYRNRSVVRTGMLFRGSTPTRAFASRGYLWGAVWSRPDYQHFEP